MKKFLLSITLVMVSFSVFAEEPTYTPQELRDMVFNGQYPEQGTVENTRTRDLSFPSCKIAIENVMSQMRGIYPVETIANTNILYVIKAWVNDAAITASCSKPDRKMVLTQAPYK